MRLVAWVVAALILLGLAFGGGLALGTAQNLISAIGVPPLLGEGAEGKVAPLVPDWETWVYPEADVRGSATGPSMSARGPEHARVLGLGHCHRYATEADFDTVYAFYRDLLNDAGEFADGDGLPEGLKATGGGGAGGRFGFATGAGFTGTSYFYADASRGADSEKPPGYESRPLRMVTLGLRTGSYFATVTITRAETEKLTHITIVRDFSGKQALPEPNGEDAGEDAAEEK